MATLVYSSFGGDGEGCFLGGYFRFEESAVYEGIVDGKAHDFGRAGKETEDDSGGEGGVVGEEHFGRGDAVAVEDLLRGHDGDFGVGGVEAAIKSANRFVGEEGEFGPGGLPEVVGEFGGEVDGSGGVEEGVRVEEGGELGVGGGRRG